MVPEDTPVSEDATRIVYTGCMSVSSDIITLKVSVQSKETLDKRNKESCQDRRQANCDGCHNCLTNKPGKSGLYHPAENACIQ